MNLASDLRGASRERGVTLIELMTALVVMGVLMAVAVPSFQNLAQNNAMRRTTTDLVTALNMARTQAVSLRRSVTVTARDGDWGKGWTLEYPSSVPEDNQVFVTDDRVSVSLSEGTATTITFTSRGIASGFGAGTLTFRLCPERGTAGRDIQLSRFGRVKNTNHDCG